MTSHQYKNTEPNWIKKRRDELTTKVDAPRRMKRWDIVNRRDKQNVTKTKLLLRKCNENC